MDKAETAAEELRTEDEHEFRQCRTWQKAKQLVDSGHDPAKVILTGQSWTEIAAGMITASFSDNEAYNEIQVLPECDVDEYLEAVKNGWDVTNG